jgi:hypothetical protein
MAKCLVAFKMNIDDSINKRIVTGVQKRAGAPAEPSAWNLSIERQNENFE